MTVEKAEQIALIDLGKLEVHPSNPRKVQGDLEELAASIKSVGLIEPIVAVRKNGKYQVVAGSRRLAAARKAKVGEVPVRVMELDEAEATAAALIENLQRKDLEPLEQAEAFRGWLALTGKTQKELAEKVGLAPSTIANALRLLEAPKLVQDALRAKRIGAEHVRVLLTLKDPNDAAEALKEAGHRAVRFEGEDGQVRVTELRYVVERANERYESEGPPAQEKLRAFLAEAKTKHPTATITWAVEEGGRRSGLFAKALGKPPAKPLGEIWDQKRHAKGCKCEAFQIVSEYRGPDDRASLRLERVCVDAKGWKKFNPSGRTHDRYARPKTKAQREKEMRDDAVNAVASVHRYHRYTPKETAVHKKLVKHRDVERVILMALADHMSAPSYTYFAWQAVKALSPKQVRERIRWLGVQKVIRGAGSYGSKKTDRGMEAVLADLKVDPIELGYVVAKKTKR
jgi:ParB family chromosome partitioning protein